MNKSRRKAVLTSLAGCMVMSTANAGTVAGNGGATEVTQILNNTELMIQSSQMYQELQQTILQVKMAEQQLKNLLAAPMMVWGQVQSELNALRTLVAKGQALGYALGNIDEAFKTRFKGYTAPLKGGFKAASQDWTRTSLDSIKSALDSAGLQSAMFATEQAAMESIQDVASNATGALQAAQAGVMVASQQVQQLQKLRQLYMAQMQAQNAYLAKKEQQEANDRSTMDSHFVQYSGSAPDFSSRGGKH